ncbi:hypothetical protein FBEOM_11661 [Fusarium beomiforme]|uniref:Uncharacterized protein n=1 Tax=Fusarium beomiforme TaxID=44412 RepID=A0A9P5A9H8_9HYPO|nr:hypothetical protein FBEOM_11661 [Fusarium beomiforme]
MGNAPRRYMWKDSQEISLTDEQCRQYLSGSCGKCFCGSGATNRREHLRLYHGQITSKWIEEQKAENFVDCEYHARPKKCSKKNISRCRKEAMANYVKRVQRYVEEAINRLETKVSSLDPETREHADAEEMLGYLRSAEYGHPISYSQYKQKIRKKLPNEFLFCTREEAKDILSRGPPKMPIIIPCPPMTVERSQRLSRFQKEIKEVIGAKMWVDIYDSGKKDLPRVPEKMAGREALRRFESTDESPVNSLNNPIPQGMAESHWMAKITGYNMAEKLVKQAQEENLNLGNFLLALIVLLLASTDAITLRHVDKAAETTCIESIMGSKLWELSSDRSKEAVRNFGEKGTCSSGTFVLSVDEGDTLIQPPQTIHSVYTRKKSMLLCDQYLDSRTMLSTLEQTLLELQYDNITNDDHHEGLLHYLDKAMEKWKEDARLGKQEPWPDAKHLEEAEDIMGKIRRHKETSSRIAISNAQRKVNVPKTKTGQAGVVRRGAYRVGKTIRKQQVRKTRSSGTMQWT